MGQGHTTYGVQATAGMRQDRLAKMKADAMKREQARKQQADAAKAKAVSVAESATATPKPVVSGGEVAPARCAIALSSDGLRRPRQH